VHAAELQMKFVCYCLMVMCYNLKLTK